MATRTTIKVTVVSHTRKDAVFKKLFRDILKDYCKRFGVKVQRGKWEVDIVLAAYGGDDDDPHSEAGQGETTQTDYKIIVQVKDPYLNKPDLKPHILLNSAYMVTVIHEFVHVCQLMTGRKGVTMKANYDKTEREVYYFDPSEIEARILQEFYLHLVPLSMWEWLASEPESV